MERNDDDLSDRMNHRFTVSLLVVLSIVISTKTYVGDRIQCWHPAHFSDSWNEYTDSYCWIKDTYNLPFSEHIPRPHEGEKRERLSYYQWVPIILLAQAFLFYAPIIVWRSLNERYVLQLCNHKTNRVCLHRGRNGFSPYKKGSCSITQLLSRPKVLKSHCVISQEPFLYSVRTLSSLPKYEAKEAFGGVRSVQRSKIETEMPHFATSYFRCKKEIGCT